MVKNLTFPRILLYTSGVAKCVGDDNCLRVQKLPLCGFEITSKSAQNANVLETLEVKNFMGDYAHNPPGDLTLSVLFLSAPPSFITLATLVHYTSMKISLSISWSGYKNINCE